jgi:transcriptional regulator with XRE-family HTH domain
MLPDLFALEIPIPQCYVNQRIREMGGLMSDERATTFGSYISQQRRVRGLGQKQLAEQIQREEGGSISPQYLNDIEHDRRSPSSDHMINEFARVLQLSANYLFYLTGRVPAAARRRDATPQDVDQWVQAFRRSAPNKKR